MRLFLSGYMPCNITVYLNADIGSVYGALKYIETLGTVETIACMISLYTNPIHHICDAITSQP